MDLEIAELEKHWDLYVRWCSGQGLHPDFGDYLVWLDDQDIDVGQERAEHAS